MAKPPIKRGNKNAFQDYSLMCSGMRMRKVQQTYAKGFNPMRKVLLKKRKSISKGGLNQAPYTVKRGCLLPLFVKSLGMHDFTKEFGLC